MKVLSYRSSLSQELFIVSTTKSPETKVNQTTLWKGNLAVCEPRAFDCDDEPQ